MAFVRVKNRFVYLDHKRKLGLMMAVLSKEEQLEVLSKGEDLQSGLMKLFQWKARKFLTLMLDKEEKLFAENFEKIEFWTKDARRELPQLIIDWCEISGRFKVWEQAMGLPLGDNLTLSERNPNGWMRLLLKGWIMPKVQFRLDCNDLMCVSGTLDNLVLQFGGCLMTLSKDQVSCMMCAEPTVKTFKEEQSLSPSDPIPQESPTNEKKPVKAITWEPKFPSTTFKYIFSTLFLLFLIGFGVDSLIPMPPNALLLVDTSGNYYPPPCLMDKGFGSMRGINAFAEARGYEVTWKSELRKDQRLSHDCMGSRYIAQEGRSVSGELLEWIGLLPPLPSRWNANGSWNY